MKKYLDIAQSLEAAKDDASAALDGLIEHIEFLRDEQVTLTDAYEYGETGTVKLQEAIDATVEHADRIKDLAQSYAIAATTVNNYRTALALLSEAGKKYSQCTTCGTTRTTEV